MLKLIYFLLFYCLGALAQDFQSNSESLSPELKKKMISVTWKKGCPVSLEDLVLVKFSYWDFDSKFQTGTVVVHKKVANGLVEIFKILFETHFLFEKVNLIYLYGGDDEKSMEDNNTSAFNCRMVTGEIHKFSLHAYGLAIDINPKTNPYIKNGKVLPENANQYRDRSLIEKGMIKQNDRIVQEFKKRGWEWGGDWKNPIDYQHFQFQPSKL
ncbi:MAG: M15 family metallopeptidase [Halobacteriovoraceae bacterium]|nr:M15 family metallopeptidase [Halobacteriovoraceae bacterium]MCB9095214.1 M15 family metallopeptidase [Halobacteriovoraceae bacterium]